MGFFRGTFREVLKKKSADNYEALPYVTTLLSTSLWTFYGALDPDDGVLIITANSVGMAAQATYLALYLIYASNDKKVKFFGLVILDIVFLGTAMAVTLVAFQGILCATFPIAMYAAPLSAMKAVIKTKSVEYMPYFLSLFLFVNAGVWFTFAMLLKDYYVLVPNALGIVLGSLQLLLYFLYKKNSPLKMMAEEGTSNVAKEGIRMNNLVEDDEPKGIIKNHSNGSLQDPSVSRQYGLQRVMKTLSPSK
ncbi:unnamed protein product [Ilex paraguariensis]